MGKVAAIEHAGRKITLSMVKFGLSKRILLKIKPKYPQLAMFTPRYEIALFDGGPEAVISLHKPHLIFYYPDADTATRKWGELVAAVEQGGLHGNEIIQFIRNGDPCEQGLYAGGLHRALETELMKLQ
jgi:hypothetical protein